MEIAYHDDKKGLKVLPPDPRCRCRAPISIVIRPGEHIHPCPVHPDVAMYGSSYTFS